MRILPPSPITLFIRRITYITPQKNSYVFTRLLQHSHSKPSTQIIHANIIISGHHQNPFLASNLITKYSHIDTEHARKVFDHLPHRSKDIFLYNTIIQTYANSGPFSQALSIYNNMRVSNIAPNKYTFPFLLKACAAIKELKDGQVIHTHVVKYGFEFDLFVGNALVAFYAKCGGIKEFRRVFDEMPERDVVSWNSLMSGYVMNGETDEAIGVFNWMLRCGCCRGPDDASFVAILPACAQVGGIKEGLWIHCYVIKKNMPVHSAIGSGLIAMYANCGRLKTARRVFDRICDKNIVVWTAIIRGYGMHGCADEALELFSRLVESGLRPDGIVFLCLLSTCSHAGMVEEGWELFEKMGDYGVERNNQHYACMVDLLGRAGFLDEAVEFIKTMPLQPGKDVYGALLGACRIHNNMELADEVAEKLYVLDPDNAGRRLILAKMYVDVGRLEDAARVRMTLREEQIKRPPGCSSIEVNCVFHTFGVEDESHPLSEKIFDTLERLDWAMEEEPVLF